MDKNRNMRVALATVVIASGVATLSPIWGVKFPPFLDYPNHLASSYVLAHLHDGSTRFSEWYGFRFGLFPYIGWDILLRAIDWLLPVEIAGRVVLSLGALGLPLGTWFFFRKANPGNDAAAFWALVGVHNIFFLLGYLNFYLSLAMCFTCLAMWLRWLERPRVGAWIAATACFTAFYLFHIVSIFAAGLVVTSYCLFSRKPWRELLWTWGLFVPAGLLYLISGRAIMHGTMGVIYMGFEDKLDNFWGIMHGFSHRLDQVCLAGVAVYFLAAWFRNPEFHWNWRWVGVAGVLFAAYWALPWAYGEGSDFDVRMLPIFFGVIFASARVGRRGWWLVPLALVLFAARLTNVMVNYRAMQPELEGLAGSFNATTMNARVLPLIQAPEDTDALHHPFAHFWAYGVIRRHWFSAYLFDIPGVTLLRVTQESYTPDGFWDLDYTEKLDWNQIQSDYDYVWAYNTPQYAESLGKIGEVVYANGWLRLYRVHTTD